MPSWAPIAASAGTTGKSTRRGIERIQQIDDRYVLLEFVAGQSGEPDCLRVIRRCRHPAADEVRDGGARGAAWISFTSPPCCASLLVMCSVYGDSPADADGRSASAAAAHAGAVCVERGSKPGDGLRVLQPASQMMTARTSCSGKPFRDTRSPSRVPARR